MEGELLMKKRILLMDDESHVKPTSVSQEISSELESFFPTTERGIYDGSYATLADEWLMLLISLRQTPCDDVNNRLKMLAHRNLLATYNNPTWVKSQIEAAEIKFKRLSDKECARVQAIMDLKNGKSDGYTKQLTIEMVTPQGHIDEILEAMNTKRAPLIYLFPYDKVADDTFKMIMRYDINTPEKDIVGKCIIGTAEVKNSQIRVLSYVKPKFLYLFDNPKFQIHPGEPAYGVITVLRILHTSLVDGWKGSA